VTSVSRTIRSSQTFVILTDSRDAVAKIDAFFRKSGGVIIPLTPGDLGRADRPNWYERRETSNALLCIVTCLLTNVALAEGSDSSPVLAQAITAHARQLSRDARATTHRSGAIGTQLRQCRSKKKGAIIGAAIGAAAGGVFALYVSGAASGVPGVAQGAAR
jgi:hypothetical protein